MKTAYDPSAKFELKEWEVEFRRTPARPLLAHIYQPLGTQTFPTLLDLHGGGWSNKNRFANEPMDRAVAASGMLVVAIDMTVASEAHYPASLQDANYGIRWLKSNAAEWNGIAANLGVLGSSSGGHIAQLLGMRPGDPRYNAYPLSENRDIDASVAYIAARSPISDPYARFQQSEKIGHAKMPQMTKAFFDPWDSIFEANPQQILDRKETVTLPPLLIMQGELDETVTRPMQEKFVASYRAAGGECQFEFFEGCEHEWVATPGPQTDRAHQVLKTFIARQLNKKH